MRHDAKHVQHCAENVRHGAKNKRHGAKNVRHGAKNVPPIPQSPIQWNTINVIRQTINRVKHTHMHADQHINTRNRSGLLKGRGN